MRMGGGHHAEKENRQHNPVHLEEKRQFCERNDKINIISCGGQKARLMFCFMVY